MISVLWVEAKDGANSLQCTRQSPRQRTIRPKIPIELMLRSIVPAEKTINLSMDKKTAASNQGNGKMEQGDQRERERPGGIATEAEDPAARIRSRVEGTACAKDVRQEGARQEGGQTGLAQGSGLARREEWSCTRITFGGLSASPMAKRVRAWNLESAPAAP